MLRKFCTGPSRWGLLSRLLDLPPWFMGLEEGGLRKCEVTQVVLGCPSGSHELVVYLETRSRKVEDKEQKGKQATGGMASWVDTRWG